MSMISAQINELRKWADQLSERENEFGVMVRALVAALRDAADTIWQLRDDLQRSNAAVQDAEHDESMAWDRVRKAEAENAKLQDENARLRSCLSDDADNARQIMAENEKLRELVREMCEWAYIDSYCDLQQEFADRLRELGIEVGEYVVEEPSDGSASWRVHELIVRCRDCEYRADSPAWPGAMECCYIGRGVEPDGFCAWGERRDA